MLKSKSQAKLDKEINTLLEKLESMSDKSSDDYGTIVERIAKLHKLRTEEGLKLPNLDTALVVGANVFGIIWLTRFEKENVIPSRSALGFVMKPRT
jgi:hypothetical protein